MMTVIIQMTLVRGDATLTFTIRKSEEPITPPIHQWHTSRSGSPPLLAS